MNERMLDIIVTRYDEPWDVGKKFFAMLALQRDVDFDSFRVIIVQDDSKNYFPDYSTLLMNVPYKFTEVDLKEHVGPAGARNAGLSKATAQWVMFCDFDDTFTNVCSLKLITEVLSSNKADVGWFDTWQEEKRSERFVNVLHENISSTNGKVYRRDVLNRNRIVFDPRLQHLYESSFNSHVLSVIPQHRILNITMPFAAYMKTFREDGYNNNIGTLKDVLNEMLIVNVFNTNKAIEENRIADARYFFADALFDAYFIMNNNFSSVTDDRRKDFAEFVEKTWKILRKIDQYSLEVSMRNACMRMDIFVQKVYMTYGIEMLPPLDEMSLALQWIRNTFEIDLMPKKELRKTTRPKRSGSERVVVYCGTRNTYEYMVASCKSLLQHTQVDKVYFLTEDDVFPEPLPEIITNINVSQQQYFKPSGPNYDNVWSYMCLMRAVFTKLLPEHSRVLSLDIDTVIAQDISELFDIDMTNSYIAGVHEIKRSQEDYINFGVVMMNLSKLRKDGMDDLIVSALNKEKYDCPEQSVFSELCARHILLLPTEYNYVTHSTLTGECSNPKIIHYAGIKYWKHYSGFRKYKDFPWECIVGKKVTQS